MHHRTYLTMCGFFCATKDLSVQFSQVYTRNEKTGHNTEFENKPKSLFHFYSYESIHM